MEETLALGRAIGRALSGGVVVGLVGPLGAGKTQLVKGIAAGNAGREECAVTSPTFTLVQEYPGRLLLYHLDAYRLRSTREFVALGFDELPREDSAVVVEWADRVESAMPTDALWIELVPTGETGRRIVGRATGSEAATFLVRIRAELQVPPTSVVPVPEKPRGGG